MIGCSPVGPAGQVPPSSLSGYNSESVRPPFLLWGGQGKLSVQWQ